MYRFLRLSSRVLLAAGVLLLFSALGAGSASAHARLTSSNPTDGATLTSEPTTVSATYGEETSLTKSRFQVFYAKDASSAQVQADNGDGHVDTNARTQMSATLKPGLGAGVYTVKWHTVTEDDNGIVDGTITFTVSGAAMSGNSSNSAAMSGSTTMPSTGQPSPLLPLAGLLAGLVLLVGLGLRRVAVR